MRLPFRRLGHFGADVWRRFFDDGCFTLAGSLTCTSLLSLVPLLTIALTLITAFPEFESVTRGVDDFIAKNMLPPAVAKTVTGSPTFIGDWRSIRSAGRAKRPTPRSTRYSSRAAAGVRGRSTRR